MFFTKMHGIGNDFVVVDARNLQEDWESLSREICNRHYGIGADGLILVCNPEGNNDLKMRVINPDGSEAEMCGNGIRCFTKYVLDNKINSLTEPELSIETLAGNLKTIATFQQGKVKEVTVNMGIPEIIETPKELIFDGTKLKLSFISMGNPHTIAFLNEPIAEFPLETIGPKVENHELFPNRTNFEIANILNRNQIEIRVWERGAGITLACGTGACATVVAARLQGLIDEEVGVNLPGGELHIKWDGKNEVFMTGLAEVSFTGEWRR